MDKSAKLLFITRNFPPLTGGLERLTFHLYSHLSKELDVVILKWGGGVKLLPLIIPFFIVRAVFILLTQKIDIIYLNEGFISIIGVILKIFNKPIVITVHGLDIVYRNSLYQLIIPKCIGYMDKIICVSSATRQACLDRGIDKKKISIVSPGYNDDFYLNTNRVELKNIFMEKFGIDIKEKKILISVGRLIERKGFIWFLEKIMPKLLNEHESIWYFIVGGGPMSKQIEEVIDKNNLYDSVRLLGNIDEDMLKVLYNISDMFLMPNVFVEGDMEGFGIVILEAASCKVPVIASSIEGIKDAIKDGKNGYLVPLGDEIYYLNKIKEVLLGNNQQFKEQARLYTKNNFSYPVIAKKYLREFKMVLQ